MVVVARRQWLVSSSTEEDENTLVVWKQLYCDKQLYCSQWDKATFTVGLQLEGSHWAPQHSEEPRNYHFANWRLTEHECWFPHNLALMAAFSPLSFNPVIFISLFSDCLLNLQSSLFSTLVFLRTAENQRIYCENTCESSDFTAFGVLMFASWFIYFAFIFYDIPVKHCMACAENMLCTL